MWSPASLPMFPVVYKLVLAILVAILAPSSTAVPFAKYAQEPCAVPLLEGLLPVVLAVHI